MNLRAIDLGGLRPRTVLVAVELALVVALAAQSARLVWDLVTPLGPIGAAPARSAGPRPAQDLSILAQFDPFFRLPTTTASGGEPASGGLVLFGVRVGQNGKGSAILGPAGGAQKSFEVGQEVEPGVVLQAVAATHVTLARGGGRTRVAFPQPSPSNAPAYVPPPTAAVTTTPAVDPKRLLDQAGLLPRTGAGAAGYQIFARGGSDVLRTAGLQAGDVLLAVDGVVLTRERISELPQTLAASKEVEVRFERGGQVMTKRIQMAPQ